MTDQPLEPPETEETRVSEPIPAEPARTPEPEPEPEAEPEAEAEGEPEPVASPPPRQLRRSRDDRVIAGLCGGLGKYLGVDPVLIRIAAVLLVFAGGAGILLYVIGWIAIPDEPEEGMTVTPPLAATPTAERTGGAVALGLVFVLLGAIFLLDQVWPDLFSWKYVWPIALIVVGALILLRARR